ncbi:MAG: PhoH family protein [Caldisericia bacterium]|nr:PhoH family protein [Caldisericia bacterium]
MTKDELKRSIISIKEKNYKITREFFVDVVFVSSKGKKIKPKSENQKKYIEMIRKKDLVFCIGPAGSGKTYLAIASALSYLFDKRVERIILTKPVVEAGEKLGFLPGTFLEKVDPHFRPLYDALYDLVEVEKITRLIENNIIEIAPLAYMRGRTLNDSFIILDEAQNTTYSQMKMFLTRMGFNSKVVITGDITQIDIDNPKDSGLVKAIKILKNLDEIGIVELEKIDIVRNPIVQKIVEAYENFENYKKKNKFED